MATWYVMFQEAGWLYNCFSALINLREYAGKMCHFLLLAPWQLCDHGQISYGSVSQYFNRKFNTYLGHIIGNFEEQLK